MKIPAILYPKGSFCATQKESDKNENPITIGGERVTLFHATVLAGIAAGGRALWWFCEEGFLFEGLGNMGEKLVDKNKPNVTGSKKQFLYMGAWAALTAGFVAAVAAIYTITKAPEIMYNGKVNAFKKGKNMDVYIKSNKVERELYDQMNDKAKTSSAEEKEVLAQQYLKLKAAKNQLPDFIQAQIA